jgi:hypothetical protein
MEAMKSTKGLGKWQAKRGRFTVQQSAAAMNRHERRMHQAHERRQNRFMNKLIEKLGGEIS